MENTRKELMPLVSVLLPVYNAEPYLDECLETIHKQTYSNLEIIAIEDDSSDGSYNKLVEFSKKDNRIKIYQNTTNQGLAKTLNIGLEKCNGEFIARIDADDKMSLQRIEKQVSYLRSNPGISVVSSWMEVFDEKGNTSIVKYRTNIDEIKSTILFYSPVSHAASLFKSDVLKEYKYNDAFVYSQDYELWFRVMQKHKVGVIPEILYFYRTHSQQSLSTRKKSVALELKRTLVNNFHSYFNINSSTELVDYHIENCLNLPVKMDFESFMIWNHYLQNFLNKKKALMKDAYFIRFVFRNYWQKYFWDLYPTITIAQLYKLLKTPFCQFSKVFKIKLLVKKAIR